MESEHPDLSEYRMLFDTRLEACRQDNITILNVGWLGTEHPFPQGEVSDLFLDRLFHLCRHHVVMQFRSFTPCNFCGRQYYERTYMDKGKEVFSRTSMVSEARGDEVLFIGRSQIYVRGKDNIVYAAPTMIYHYVVQHHYLPPAEFVEAILASEHPEFSAPWVI